MFCWAASHKNECPQGFLHFGSMCKPRLTQQDHTQCSNLSQFELISNIRHISTVCEHTASRRKNLLGPSGLFRTLMTSTLWGHASLCKFQTYVELTRRTTFRKTCHRVPSCSQHRWPGMPPVATRRNNVVLFFGFVRTKE